jgi:hypothetical protein
MSNAVKPLLEAKFTRTSSSEHLSIKFPTLVSSFSAYSTGINDSLVNFESIMWTRSTVAASPALLHFSSALNCFWHVNTSPANILLSLSLQ